MSISHDQIILNAEQKGRLARLAEETGKPWDEVLGEALAAFRPLSASAEERRQESFYDVARRLGFIGSLDGGPPDLSTNPKYMEGFGKSDT